MTGQLGPKRRLLPGSVWTLLAQRLRLSPREAHILRGLLYDLSESQIARLSGISRHTVHTHVRHLYRKLGVTSRCAAVARVFEEYLAFERHLGLDFSPSASTEIHRD